MPGLIGAAERQPNADLRAVFESLAGPMARGGRIHGEKLVDPQGRWALGRFHLGRLQPDAQLRAGERVQALFHGDLHNEAELRNVLGDSGSGAASPRGTAALIAALYRKLGAGLAARLRGAYCAAVLDEEAGQLVLLNDLLGTYPIYWFSGPGRFVFASELKSILRDPALRRTLDPRAVADYLQFGLLFGEKTLAEGVSLLPAGATLTYKFTDGSTSVSRHRRIEEAFQPWEGGKAEFTERLTDAFAQSVGRTLQGEHRFGLSLSGGLDSRVILSAIDCSKTPLSTYTLGVKGCADEVIADKLAKLAGTSHRFFELDEKYLGDFLPNLRKMVSLTDGMYLTHGLTEMLALRFLEDADFAVLLRGHGGELLKASLAWPFHTDDRVRAMRSREEFIPYFFDRVNYISNGVSLRELFTDSWFERVNGAARRSLDESLKDVPLAPADLATYVYLHEHHRRFTVPSLELFRNTLEVRLPFVDEEFLGLLFRAPSSWRDGTDLHRAMTGARNPALLKVRNSNTGAPGNAGPILEKVLDKVNSLFKRLNVHGFRHYHNFQAWMQRTLIEAVEEVLLGKTALARGLCKEATLRRFIDETKRGVADHGYLFQVLLILELWQEENL
jgi:asparagine synthase (glutamine-hydrolysing)